MKGRLLFLACLLLAASPAYAEDRRPALALAVGSGLDLVTTLHALHTVPGAVEGNPLLSHGGTAGLVVTKTALTVGLAWAVTRIARDGHPRLAKVIGYTSGIVFTSVAIHNARVGR